MSAVMSSFWFHMLVFLVVGWIFYALDRRFGRNWYRKWYDFSHEENLPLETVRGFVCGRSGKTQCKMALLLAVLTTVVMATFSEGRTLVWVFTCVFGVFVVVFSFITGPLVMKLWGKREDVYKTIDDLEAGKINPVDGVKQVGKGLRSRLSGILGWFGGLWNGPQPEAPADPSETAAPQVPPPAILDGSSAEPRITAPASIFELEDRPAPGSSGDGGKQAPRELTPEEKIQKFTGG